MSAKSASRGMKISILYPDDGAFVIASPSSVIKGSPNPNAAKAFAEFMLSRDVQELFPKEFLYSARTDIAGPQGYPPLTSIKIHAGRLRLHRGGERAHPTAVQRGDAVGA